jgi:hypothetical protein
VAEICYPADSGMLLCTCYAATVLEAGADTRSVCNAAGSI